VVSVRIRSGGDPEIVLEDAAKEDQRAAAAALASASVFVPERVIATRDVLRRLTAREHRGIARVAETDDDVLKLWNILRAGGTVDLASPELVAGLAVLQARGVPAVWPDAVAAAARFAAILAA
jgi:hypothetical protein